ncbi:MAG: hypothetical protein K2Q06_11770 [Parvularculaceae bacterium]|nr:hypothetical protein [Parvularculaceae bacterium]
MATIAGDGASGSALVDFGSVADGEAEASGFSGPAASFCGDIDFLNMEFLEISQKILLSGHGSFCRRIQEK